MARPLPNSGGQCCGGLSRPPQIYRALNPLLRRPGATRHYWIRNGCENRDETGRRSCDSFSYTPSKRKRYSPPEGTEGSGYGPACLSTKAPTKRTISTVLGQRISSPGTTSPKTSFHRPSEYSCKLTSQELMSRSVGPRFRIRTVTCSPGWYAAFSGSMLTNRASGCATLEQAIALNAKARPTVATRLLKKELIVYQIEYAWLRALA